MANTYPRTLSSVLDTLEDPQTSPLERFIRDVDPDYEVRVQNYNSLVNKVYDWANRDLQALPVQIVKDSIRYAVDKAYRTLRIPPMEHVCLLYTSPSPRDS